jgi:hypothetical protein
MKNTKDVGIDLFEDYTNIPAKVHTILDKYEGAFVDGDYKQLEKAHKALNKTGYTFEYYLDGQAYDLRPIGTKGKSEMDEFRKGGRIISKEDITILGVPRSKITEFDWKSILGMAKHLDHATFILKNEKGLDVKPQVEFEWYVKDNMAKGGNLGFCYSIGGL